MRHLQTYFRFVYHSPRHLLIHVLFLLLMGYLVIESQHEDTLYRNIIRVNKRNTSSTEDSVYISNLMRTIHTMMHNRLAIFNNTEKLSWKNSLFQSVDSDLMYGHGACGGFSKVLARSLQLSGYKVRIGQMQVDGRFGGHIIVEVFLPKLNRWAVIDPLFLLTFNSSKDGHWAGFEEIRDNWNTYSKQVPANYDVRYRYEDIRYTNWEKIPLAGSAVYSSLKALLGKEKAEAISIRVWILNKYYTYLCAIGIAYLFFIWVSVRRFKRSPHRRPVPALPVHS